MTNPNLSFKRLGYGLSVLIMALAALSVPGAMAAPHRVQKRDIFSDIVSLDFSNASLPYS